MVQNWNDLFQFHGKQYLVVVDYYSSFIEVDRFEETTASTVIKAMKRQFARYGIPEEVVSNQRPQYTSREFKQFSRTWDF